jgi:DNA-binding beta-propeller fold protein YncE
MISDGKLLISDNGASDFGQNQGNIYYLDPTNSTSGIFFSNSALGPLGFPPFGVNGLAFSPEKSALFMGNTSTDTIYKLDLTGCAVSCLPGNFSVFAQGGPIDGPDNIDFDDNGLLWVASSQKDQVVVLNAQGLVVQVVGSFRGLSSDGAPISLMQPAGIVFSQGNIYVANQANPTLRLVNVPINMIGNPPRYEGLNIYTIARIQEVPESSTIMGMGVVLGAMSLLKKDYAKSNKKKDKDT